ncbi:MAG TPA: hypothetical protein VFU00_00520 [Gemmatimonadales bacterium]|nr:hypothetical protein [Gemmatimonadales bacterium]
MPRLLLFLLVVALAGCSTGPDEGRNTLLARFGADLTDADVAALRAVGGEVQHRMELARSVSLRTPLPPASYASVAGVESVTDLGEEADPDVSVFIDVLDVPDEADSAFVASRGASFVYVSQEYRVIAAVMPLGRVAELDARSRFVAVSVHADAAVIQ